MDSRIVVRVAIKMEQTLQDPWDGLGWWFEADLGASERAEARAPSYAAEEQTGIIERLLIWTGLTAIQFGAWMSRRVEPLVP